MQSTQSAPLIEVRDVSVSYDRRIALSNASLTLCEGDFMAVSGPNGGGKTTLLRVMLRLLKPTSGTVRYFSGGKPAKYLSIGYLPQKSNIDVRFPISVAEVVKSGLLGSSLFPGRMTDADREAIERTVEKTGIAPYLDKPIGELSGGQMQRALIARAIVSGPELLVLDEPLSYVDKEFERQIYSLMEELSGQCTILLVSHEMSVISRMANRHIIVDHTVHQCPAHTHYSQSDCL